MTRIRCTNLALVGLAALVGSVGEIASDGGVAALHERGFDSVGVGGR